jgi:fumarate hydratase class II
MVCVQVMAHDVAVGFAASLGQFELNVCKPLIALDLLDSLRLLTDAMASFRSHCVEGIEVDAERARSMLAHSLVGVTALVPHLGYDRAAQIGRHAHAQSLDLRQAALDVGGISAAEFDEWVDVRQMLGRG